MQFHVKIFWFIWFQEFFCLDFFEFSGPLCIKLDVDQCLSKKPDELARCHMSFVYVHNSISLMEWKLLLKKNWVGSLPSAHSTWSNIRRTRPSAWCTQNTRARITHDDHVYLQYKTLFQMSFREAIFRIYTTYGPYGHIGN